MCCVAAADHQDMHYADQAGPLCRASSFAHGFLHGYEEGFHEADQNVQLGRIYRTPALAKSTPPTHVPVPQGADRKLFKNGYKLGFSDGYSDGVSGREFRAIEYLRSVATGITPAQFSNAFDVGFADGFKAGRASPQPMPIGYVSSYCRNARGRAKKHSGREDDQPYCNGYGRGFMMGYASGHNAPTGTVSATAAGSQ
jgi:hypothetical protein